MARLLIVSLVVLCGAAIGSALRCNGCAATIDLRAGDFKCTDGSLNYYMTTVVECAGNCITAQAFTFNAIGATAETKLGCVTQPVPLAVNCFKDYTTSIDVTTRICGCTGEKCNGILKPCDGIKDACPRFTRTGSTGSSIAIGFGAVTTGLLIHAVQL